MTILTKFMRHVLIAGGILGSTISYTEACSRFTYTGLDNLIVTGRSMDWVEDTKSDLWAFPAGIERNGRAGENSISWVSKYGSLVVSMYNVAAVDGINTKGLNASALYLSPTNYGVPQAKRQNLSLYMWTQYILDNFATVNEVVAALEQDKVNMIDPILPNGAESLAHLAVTDPTGDNAIFEYIDGKLTIHHGSQYKVMTNEPSYDKQLTLNAYWQHLEGKFLPGNQDATDRFVRASYYLNNAEPNASAQKSVAIVASILRNVSSPLSLQVQGVPSTSHTIWRAFADLKNMVYYFEATDRPNLFWVNIKDLNLSPGAPIQKLSMVNDEIYNGEVSKYFAKTKPFIVPEVTAPKSKAN